MTPLSTTTPNQTLLAAAQGNGKTVADNVKHMREMKRIDEAAAEFESVYISEMMKPMFEGISTDGMFGGGKGEEVFRGILLQEYGKLIAKTGSVGIAAPVREAMIKMQAQADGKADEVPVAQDLTPKQNKEIK